MPLRVNLEERNKLLSAVFVDFPEAHVGVAQMLSLVVSRQLQGDDKALYSTVEHVADAENLIKFLQSNARRPELDTLDR